MNALPQFRHRVVRPPIAAALQAAGFLRDLVSIFRADPRQVATLGVRLIRGNPCAFQRFQPKGWRNP